MKKKRSIQKLSFHKETISTLNEVVGGHVTTTIATGTTIAVTKTVKPTCKANCTYDPGKTLNWMICAANDTEDC